MNNELITPEEIEQVKSNMMVFDITKSFFIVPNITILNSGYTIIFSQDKLLEFHEDVFHISISHLAHKPDPADEEHIAKAILGEKYIVRTIRNRNHFFSCTNIEQLNEILKPL